MGPHQLFQLGLEVISYKVVTPISRSEITPVNYPFNHFYIFGQPNRRTHELFLPPSITFFGSFTGPIGKYRDLLSEGRTPAGQMPDSRICQNVLDFLWEKNTFYGRFGWGKKTKGKGCQVCHNTQFWLKITFQLLPAWQMEVTKNPWRRSQIHPKRCLENLDAATYFATLGLWFSCWKKNTSPPHWFQGLRPAEISKVDWFGWKVSYFFRHHPWIL